MIRHFIYKELSLLKSQFKFILFIAIFVPVFFIIAGKAVELQYLPAIIVIVLSLPVSINSIYIDEKNNSNRFLLSLPLTRDQVVKAKYIGTSAVMLMLIPVLFVMETVIAVFTHVNATSYFAVIYSVLLVILLNCLFYPVNYRLGYMKAMQLYRIMYLVIFMGIPFLLSKISRSLSADAVRRLTELASTGAGIPLLLVSVCIVALLFLLSLRLSQAFYRKKEI
ncbi:MAG: ABC-2 transporter permease [Spirochaetales bacterium]|nr:ABC-2 transporter permease [Spirochaetales bacterium]